MTTEGLLTKLQGVFFELAKFLSKTLLNCETCRKSPKKKTCFANFEPENIIFVDFFYTAHKLEIFSFKNKILFISLAANAPNFQAASKLPLSPKSPILDDLTQ
jgi:hypothetical protein